MHAPDDMLLGPGDFFMVECKRPKKGAEEGQKREHERLRAAGIRVFVADTKEAIDKLPWKTS